MQGVQLGEMRPAVGLNYLLPMEWCLLVEQHEGATSMEVQKPVPDYSTLIDFDPEFCSYMIDEVQESLQTTFSEIYISPRLQREKYYCLDYRPLPGRCWPLLKDLILQPRKLLNHKPKIFIVSFLLREYSANKEESVEDIEDFVQPSCNHPLQLVLEEDGRKELHLIHCPASMLLGEVIQAYLTGLAKRNIDSWQVNLYGIDKLRYFAIQHMPRHKLSNLGYNELLVIARESRPTYSGWSQMPEEEHMTNEMDQGMIEDLGEPCFGENCPLLPGKDLDNLSEIANAGDRHDMEDNIRFLEQQQFANQTVSTGVSTPNMDSEVAQSGTSERLIGKVSRQFTPEEIEQFKQLSKEALEEEPIPLPSFKDEPEAQVELNQLAVELVQMACTRSQRQPKEA